MTDPSIALESFQQALQLGEISLRRGTVDPDLHVFADSPNGENRLTYVKLNGQTVTAFACFFVWEPIDGVPCFHFGYAVPEAYRNQGRAKDIVDAAIAEMRHGFGRAGVPAFYIEAVVGLDNKASQRVAEQSVSANPSAITDSVSGLPALQYIRKIVTAVAV